MRGGSRLVRSSEVIPRLAWKRVQRPKVSKGRGVTRQKPCFFFFSFFVYFFWCFVFFFFSWYSTVPHVGSDSEPGDVGEFQAANVG